MAEHPHEEEKKGEEMKDELKEGEVSGIEDFNNTRIANPTQLVSGKGAAMADGLKEGEICGIEDIGETRIANPAQLLSRKGDEMEDGLKEGEIGGIGDIDKTRVANPTQLVSGKDEEMEHELEEGEVRDIDNIDETSVANPTELENGKDEEMEVVNKEDGKIRDGHRDPIKESTPAKSGAPENNNVPKFLDANVVSNCKDGDLQECLNLKTANGGDCVGEPNMQQVGGVVEKQAKPCKKLDSEGDKTLEEVLRIKRALDDINNLSDRMPLELMTKLQEMDINVKILQETLIGKTVQVFLQHSVKQIRQVARSLIRTWRGKVHEWIQAQEKDEESRPGDLDEFPSPPLIKDVPATQAPSTEFSQISQGIGQTESFSILQPDSNRSCLFPEECGITEKTETPFTVNPAGNTVTEKMRSENLNWRSRNQSQFRGSHDAKINSHGLIHQGALGSHKGKNVWRKDLAETQTVKQVDMGTNAFSRDKESAAAIMKKRIPSPPKMHNFAGYKQGVHNEGTMSGHSSAMMFRGSTFQHQPFLPTWGDNYAQFGQNLQRFNTSRPRILSGPQRPQPGPLFMQQNGSGNGMMHRVDETRRPREGYLNAGDGNKRQANNTYGNQQNKRFRPHDVRRNYEGCGAFPSF